MAISLENLGGDFISAHGSGVVKLLQDLLDFSPPSWTKASSRSSYSIHFNL